MNTVRTRCIEHMWRSRVLGLRLASYVRYTPVGDPRPEQTASSAGPPSSKPRVAAAPSTPFRYTRPAASSSEPVGLSASSAASEPLAASTPAAPPPAEPEEDSSPAPAAPSPPGAPVSHPQPSEHKKPAVTLATLHHYGSGAPPNPTQVSYTARYFQTPPLHVYTAARFVQVPRSPHPEICFVGRSNVGKSSLLNALFGRPRTPLVRVSSKPGRTRTINGFGVGGGARQDSADDLKALGPGAMVVVDLPGYGKGSRQEWGEEIHKYFLQRKQLRRVFLLVDTCHGVKGSDRDLVRWFRAKSVPFTIVLAKVDRLLIPGHKQPSKNNLRIYLERLGRIKAAALKFLADLDAEKGAKGGTDVDLICCSAEKELVGVGMPRGRIGIDALRWETLRACGLDCDDRGNKRTVEGLTVLQDED